MSLDSSMELRNSGETLATPSPDGQAERAAVGSFLRQALTFVLIGLGLYLCLYVASELLVYKYALRNRFFAVHTAPLRSYDDVILGASHAAVFDYEATNSYSIRVRTEDAGGLSLATPVTVHVWNVLDVSSEPDFDLDGMPDDWEYNHSGSVTALDPNDDLDSDGAVNLIEFQADTDPTNPASVPGPGTGFGTVIIIK